MSCTGLRCGGIWRAKLSRFCTICLVRCASCRITRRSFRALSGTSGLSISRSANPRIAVKRIVHLVRDAGNQLADRRHLLRVHQLRLQHGGIGDVGHHHHDAGDVALLVAHRTQIHGELADAALVRARSGSSRLSTCCPARVAVKRLIQHLPREPATTSSPSGRPSNCLCSIAPASYQRRLA